MVLSRSTNPPGLPFVLISYFSHGLKMAEEGLRGKLLEIEEDFQSQVGVRIPVTVDFSFQQSSEWKALSVRV